jgi:hypothetical protein
LYSYIDRFLASKDSGSILLNTLKECVTPVLSSVIVYPLKTVQARLAYVSGQNEKPYESMLDCFTKIISTEGYRALYKGFDVRLLRIVVRQIAFTLVEKLVVGSGITSPAASFVVQL